VRASSPAPLGAEVRPDYGGYLKLTQSGVSDSFAQDLTDTESWSSTPPSRQQQVLRGGTVSRAGMARPRRVAILSQTNDRAIQPALQRSMASA